MIDVIMPTYNRLESLKRVVSSYMTQPELGLFIIVDDFSTENIQAWADELVRQYPGKIVYHRMNEKSTLPHIRNVGVTYAIGDYVFMGEDDVLLPKDHFKILLEKLHQYGADIIAGRRIYLREGQTPKQAEAIADTDRGPLFVRIPFEAYMERLVEKAQPVPYLHSNSLMKRSIFDTIQYDPWYGGNAFREESDFYLRVHDAGFKLWLIPDTLSYHLKNTQVNKSGGSRKKRFVYEYQVWKNTIHMFWKNRNILRKEFGVRNIIWFTIRCLVARYTYALQRRIGWFLGNVYEKT